MLHGRATERSIIDRLLARARAGHSGALVIRGEPGIGKTALLDYAAAAAGSAASAEAASGGATPGDAAPGDAAPGDAAPGDAAPGDAAPGDAAPGMIDLRVIRGAGVQFEVELQFAGLHLLLGPTLDRSSALPQPQRHALDAAFGLRRAGSHDRFLIGVAV